MKKNNKICIWVITPGGVIISERLHDSLKQCDIRVSRNIADAFDINGEYYIFEKLSSEMSRCFTLYKQHICIFSTGIAVRIIAPHLMSKLNDPAVVVIDDKGCHAISLLSGHLGGANELAMEVASITGAAPVITTATDVNDLPSIDMVASRQGLKIENPQMVKIINMAFLRGEKIYLDDPMNYVRPALSDEFILFDEKRDDYLNPGTVSRKQFSRLQPSTKVVSCRDFISPVPRETLFLRPPSLVVGMGCNRGTSKEELLCFLKSVFKENQLALDSIALIASVDVKKDESGLLALSEALEKPVKFYGKDELNSVKNIVKPSKMVEKHLGVKSVCEAAAILASSHGNLIVPKIIKGNATIALARKGQGYL